MKFKSYVRSVDAGRRLGHHLLVNAPQPPYGSENPYQQPQGQYGPPPGGAYPPQPYQGQPAPYAAPGAHPGALWGVDQYGRPLSDKSKVTAGLLSLFLGGFGVGRFFLGYTTFGILQIVITVVTIGTLGWVWPLIDTILIFTGNLTDAQGRTLRD